MAPAPKICEASTVPGRAPGVVAGFVALEKYSLMGRGWISSGFSWLKTLLNISPWAWSS